MPVTLYDVTVPVLILALTNLSNILRKAQSHAIDNNIPESDFIEARLAPDMMPLPFQVQTCSDNAKGIYVRITGADPIPMPDNEKTFDELIARVQKTLDILHAIKRDDFDGKEDKEIVLRLGVFESNLRAQDYIMKFALPNFWFHEGMAYAILRKSGVAVGKRDWLGQFT